MPPNPLSFFVQVTAWALFSNAPLSSATHEISKLPCHFNDTCDAACPQDRDIFIAVPPSHERSRSTATSFAAYVNSWRAPGALSGRENSSRMRPPNPLCFFVQVTAWALFSNAPLSSATHEISKLPCHFNDTCDAACPQDRHIFIAVPPSHERSSSTATSCAAYMNSWRAPGALSGRENSTRMRPPNPLCFFVQVTAWALFSNAPLSSATHEISKLPCLFNDTCDSACPQDRHIFIAIPPSHERSRSTATSCAAYMNSWRAPGALSGRENSTRMRPPNPLSFFVQVTAWALFSNVPLSSATHEISKLPCLFNDTCDSACPQDRHIFIAVPPSHERSRSTATSCAAYMNSWRAPGALSGRENSTRMRPPDPLCFFVQVTAWALFSNAPLSSATHEISKLPCLFNDTCDSAYPQDRHIFIAVPPSHERSSSTATSCACYMNSWRAPGALSGRENSTRMRPPNPLPFFVQVTAWALFSNAPLSSATHEISKLPCLFNDTCDSACPQDRHIFIAVPPSHERSRSTATSCAAYMNSWRAPGALSGRANSTRMRPPNPLCFFVQVTAWALFSNAPLSSATHEISKLPCLFNDTCDSACPQDRHIFIAVPPSHERSRSTATSCAAYMNSWRAPGALSGRENSTRMRPPYPLCFFVQVTAWALFSNAPLSSATHEISKLPCLFNDTCDAACPQDRHIFIAVPPSHERSRSTATSCAAYMNSWRAPGALSGRENSTRMRPPNPLCFFVQVTAWALFSNAPLSSATHEISKLPCHFNDTCDSACPQDRHIFIAVPPSHEISRSTATSCAAYMNSWRAPGALSGRENSTRMRPPNPLCFFVQVTA
ncbi:hypothetical protein V5799_018442 [Amblyomma americanum]|uniref:Uncharacterized protein n=1 Tax=Amblyomma americanum TaxID=6943 RepID=A0AAQ4F0F1_AMBAM